MTTPPPRRHPCNRIRHASTRKPAPKTESLAKVLETIGPGLRKVAKGEA